MIFHTCVSQAFGCGNPASTDPSKETWVTPVPAQHWVLLCEEPKSPNGVSYSDGPPGFIWDHRPQLMLADSLAQ